MSKVHGQQSPASAAIMGFGDGVLVQEFGWDEDVDERLREEIQDTLGAEFVYETLEAVDCVLLWWREDDGDLGDGLVDALTDLKEDGFIWLLTPKIGREGYIEATDVSEAVLTAGLSLANPVSVSEDWQAHKVVRPKSTRR